ncbi:PA14 domain protein [Planctomycetes bacterium Poly30]|uniref:PA14 domain protein n=1 Tax=Saltatorellus ferox TaxID=2528018 RepID=A0A518ERR4_9BACT|nr:PA14 domain protein [Planctomycetes bacterium Poly30]
MSQTHHLHRGTVAWGSGALLAFGSLLGGVAAGAGGVQDGQAQQGEAQQGQVQQGQDPGAEVAEERSRSTVPVAASRNRSQLIPPVESLLADFDCLSCHAPESSIRAKLDPAVPPVLDGVTLRTNPRWVTDFLLDPRATRPGTTHPHQLIAIPENARDSVALDLTHFLQSRSGPRKVRIPVESSSIAALETGRKLFHEVGCAVCHGPQESLDDLGYSLVDLTQMEPATESEAVDQPLPPGVLEPNYRRIPADLAQKGGLSDLTRYLLDPVAQRPGGFCPSMSLHPVEARSIAAYLLRESAQRVDGSFERRPGVWMQVFEPQKDGRVGFELLRQGGVTGERASRGFELDADLPDDRFALRFSGLIDLETAGDYTFHVASDDGSRLYIGGELLLDNGGVHPVREASGSITLEAGLHPIVLEYFEAEGGQALKVEWVRPGATEREAIPATALSHWPLEYKVLSRDGLPAEDTSLVMDPVRAERGREAFSKLGCATCHVGVLDSGEAPPSSAPSLAQLQGTRPGVLICLRAGRRFNFEPDTVGLLLSAFVDPDSIAVDAADPVRAVERHMTRRNCYGCHRRDGVGGVHPSLMPLFTGNEDAELGDQGRFPPTLTQVGRKLRPAVLLAAVSGIEKVRPYLHTRMPMMGVENVERLAEQLQAADLSAASLVQTNEEAGGDFNCSVTDKDAGRRLAGDRGGLGCVQCHGFLGTRSLGVQAVDMGVMHRRLRYEWFHDLLRDPSSVDMASRMATFWVDGESPIQDIAGGDIDAQIQSLWCWLGERRSMAPPPGLDTGPWAYEVDASESLRLVSVFMEGVSPSVLCVGTPTGVHFAFDVENGRLAKAWRGRFLNAMGTWQGRAGALEKPGSSDVVDLLPGFAISPMDRLNGEWTEPRGELNPAGLVTRSLGRTVGEDGSVTMRYTVGDLRVAETIRPAMVGTQISRQAAADEHLGLERSFEVRMPRSGVGQSIVARVAVARTFERAGTGKWRVNGGDWPLYQLDADSVRTAKLVEPQYEEAAAFGSGGAGRPSVDARVRGVSRSDQHSDGPGPRMIELRIPVLMAPANDGSGDLVGTFSWSFAW